MSLEKYKEVQQKINDLLEQQKKEVRQIFSEESQKIFEEFPKLNSFSWTQYTPYFNDGDECVFRVNHYYGIDFYYDGNELNTEDMDTEEEVYLANKPEIDTLSTRLYNFLKIFDYDTYKHLFGDHVKVTVYSDRVDTKDYDHD